MAHGALSNGSGWEGQDGGRRGPGLLIGSHASHDTCAVPSFTSNEKRWCVKSISSHLWLLGLFDCWFWWFAVGQNGVCDLKHRLCCANMKLFSNSGPKIFTSNGLLLLLILLSKIIVRKKEKILNE